MSHNQSIAFEIEIKKINNSPVQPAIKKKLEELSCHAAAPPQLEDIEKKHLKARNRRLDRHAKMTNIDEKVKDANQRRSILVQQFTSKTQEVVKAKSETAWQLKQNALNQVYEKAKKECKKVQSAQEKHNSDEKKKSLDAKRKGEKIESKNQNAQELRQKNIDCVLEKAKKESDKLNKAQESRNLVVKRKGEKIESQLEKADQLRSKILNQVVEQARKVTSKIDKAKESRQQSHQQRERILQDNLDKVSVGSQKSQANKEMTVQRAKTHFEKVQKIAAEYKEKLVLQSTSKNLIIASKQQNAELKKQQILDEIKVKAKQSTLMKGAKSTEQLDQENPESNQKLISQ